MAARDGAPTGGAGTPHYPTTMAPSSARTELLKVSLEVSAHFFCSQKAPATRETASRAEATGPEKHGYKHQTGSTGPRVRASC